MFKKLGAVHLPLLYNFIQKKMHIALGRKGFKKLPEGCELLNKRSELMSKCRHQAKFTLKRVKEDEEEEDENT